MREGQTVNYEELFAHNIPEPKPDVVPMRGKYDFAVAYPDPESLPLDELVESLKKAVSEEGKDLAVYPHIQGYRPLREFVAQKLYEDRDIDVSPDEIVLGDGSSQPIHLLAEVFIEPGDVVLTEHFVYSGTLNILRRFRSDVRGVMCDEEGMLPNILESAILSAISDGKKPKMIYTIPTFQNPQGWTMSLERRKSLLEMSKRHNVPILEDDCYVDLRYNGEPITSIRSLDETGHVMYVGSFSKIIAPGMRMGYLTAPPEVLDRIRATKSGSGVNQFTALAIHRYATTRLREHIEEINDVQRTKRDAMLAALGENFGSEATWSKPEGGLYIWLQMAKGQDLVSAQEAALVADVGYHPGPNFAADGASGRNYARLCFGYNTPKEIHEGVTRLAEVFAARGMLDE